MAYSEEKVSTAYWGSMIIGGFITSQIIDLAISAVIHARQPAEQTQDVPAITNEESEPKKDVFVEVATVDSTQAGVGQGSGTGACDDQESIEKRENRIRVLSGILVGDFMHNLVDGIVLGAAFYGCSKSKAWGMTAATVAHEVAQEIADYFVLTDPKLGGLTPVKSLFLNFVSGLSVVLGAIIVLAQDSVSNKTQGMLLAYGGGVYLQMAASECLPRAYEHAKSLGLRLASMLSFSLGVIGIAVILEWHEHCTPGSSTSSAGSGHSH